MRQAERPSTTTRYAFQGRFSPYTNILLQTKKKGFYPFFSTFTIMVTITNELDTTMTNERERERKIESQATI
jgi:hypothetical protein